MPCTTYLSTPILGITRWAMAPPAGRLGAAGTAGAPPRVGVSLAGGVWAGWAIAWWKARASLCWLAASAKLVPTSW